MLPEYLTFWMCQAVFVIKWLSISVCQDDINKGGKNVCFVKSCHKNFRKDYTSSALWLPEENALKDSSSLVSIFNKEKIERNEV